MQEISDEAKKTSVTYWAVIPKKWRSISSLSRHFFILQGWFGTKIDNAGAFLTTKARRQLYSEICQICATVNYFQICICKSFDDLTPASPKRRGATKVLRCYIFALFCYWLVLVEISDFQIQTILHYPCQTEAAFINFT